jgi:hypothetical protein
VEEGHQGAARLINARRETVTTTPAFRSAFARRRCLVPADGYYEWTTEGGQKQPWFLTSRDGSPLAMAGLYEVRKDDDGAPLWTCTVLTTSAPDELGQIHDRTPLLVPPTTGPGGSTPRSPTRGRTCWCPGTPGCSTPGGSTAPSATCGRGSAARRAGAADPYAAGGVSGQPPWVGLPGRRSA